LDPFLAKYDIFFFFFGKYLPNIGCSDLERPFFGFQEFLKSNFSLDLDFFFLIFAKYLIHSSLRIVCSLML
jgi:hypothetical protein